MADPITIADFTDETLDGAGVFDAMMRAVKTHVAVEFDSGRITGQDYATVYLGALQSTMDRALQFLLQKDKITLELELLEIEKEKLVIEKDQAAAQLLLIAAQVDKVTEEIELVTAEVTKATTETARINSQRALVDQQVLNAGVEFQVLEAQLCKLQAEFNLIMQQVEKALAETGLLNQKKVSEQAQTSGTGVDEDSIIGKQVKLYGAQAEGFSRDAEQKAAKIMIDTWNVRRTTDEGTQATTANGLDEPNIGRVVTKLLDGINA
jgi:hypothetical protein